MIKKFLLIITLLTLIALIACNNKENRKDSINDSSNLILSELNSDDSFLLDGKNISSFTLSDNGEIYAVEEDIPLARYNRHGELIEKYDNAGSLNSIYYYNKKIYAYDTKKNCIVAYDLSNKKQSKISHEFNIEIAEIKDLFVVNDTVFAFIVPNHFFENEEDIRHWGEPDENGYVDYGELLYCVNISDGKLIDSKIDNIISVYKSTNEDVYYYAYKDKNYGLYLYNTKSGESKKISDMNDVGYLFAFIYENNNFTYIDHDYNLYNKNFNDGSKTLLEYDVFSGPGKNVYYYGGHLVYLEIPFYDDASEKARTPKITSTYIAFLYHNTNNLNTSATSENITKRSGSLVISADPYYPVIDLTYFSKHTGIRGLIKKPPVDQIQFLTEIMAGNDDIDIYILSNTYIIDRLVEMSYYVPLNESDNFRKYVDGCFDYIANYVKSDNDEIWGIPLSTNANAIIYVPENFKRFNLTQDDIKYFENFMDTLERLHNADNDCRVVAGNSVNFFFDMMSQYSSTYNDYENNHINFKTDLYRNLFTLLDGYEYYKGENHPLFLMKYHYRYRDNLGLDHFLSNNPDKVIFKIETISDFLLPLASDSKNYSLEDWRIFPMTKLTTDVKNNEVYLEYAMINPNSKKKDDALFYLEAFIKDPHNATASTYCNFTQKDISSYTNYYDTNLPVFSDIYNIMKDGTIVKHPIPAISDQFIDDYQKGRLTLDETIDYLQREYEMALNE